MDFDINNVPEENRGGNCFEAACKHMMDSNMGWILVHGIVIGQGAIYGVPIVHAWCELGDLVCDAATGRYMRKEDYYRIGQINEEDLVKYNYEEMARLMVETMVYGCWDEELAEKGVMG